MKKTSIFIFALLALAIFLAPACARAFAVKTGDNIAVPEDETVNGNLFAAGNSIAIDGHIVGDVICGTAGKVMINGSVDGDVICAAQTIDINGEVGGSVRVAGKNIDIGGQAAHNLQAFGPSVKLENGAGVGWDMFLFAQTGKINGRVGGSLYGAATDITIAGEIDGNVNLRLDKTIRSETDPGYAPPLLIADGARIGGDITYTAGNKASVADGALITGKVTQNIPEATISTKTLIRGWAWGRLFSVFSAMVVGLIIISLWPKKIIGLTDRMTEKAGGAVGRGLILMFLAPIIVTLLLVTVIGIPLGLILFFLWLIGLYLSKIIVGILVGRGIMEKIWRRKDEQLIKAMVIGIVLCWMIFSVPVVGWMLSLLSVWWGMGGIWIYLKKA